MNISPSITLKRHVILRVTVLLLSLGAGLPLIQPCAAVSLQFEPTGSLGTARFSHTATLLPNGEVLAAGGYNSVGVSLASAELYNPASGTWVTTASLHTARSSRTATLLPNGKVLVAGGENNTVGNLASAQLYHPASGTWATTSDLNTGHIRHSATLLSNSKVLVAGGETNSGASPSAELGGRQRGTK